LSSCRRMHSTALPAADFKSLRGLKPSPWDVSAKRHAWCWKSRNPMRQNFIITRLLYIAACGMALLHGDAGRRVALPSAWKEQLPSKREERCGLGQAGHG
jgi:hypothetical protein